jgi:hypothetical protein
LPRETRVKLGTTTLALQTQGGAVDVASDSVVVSIDPSSQIVSPGETFTVAVKVAAGAQELDSVQAFVDYDASYLEAVGVSGGGVLDDAYEDISTPGEVDYAAVDPSGTVSGTFTLATITFQAKATAVSGTPLSFHTVSPRETKVKLGTATLPSTLSDGEVSIAGPPSDLTLTVSAATAMVSDTVALTATAKDELGQSVVDGTVVTFTTDLGNVGSKETTKLTTSGVATATLQSTVVGNAHVTATAGSASDSKTVTFEAGALDRVEVAPSEATLGPEETQQFTATCYDAYDNEVACTPTWSVADADAGTIDAAAGLFMAGTVAGSYPGAVVATADSITGTADVIVEEACNTVSIVDLTTDSPVALGDTMYFTATVSGTRPITYSWDFGDAGMGSGTDLDSATPTWTYSAVGSYTATLTVTNVCPSTDTRSIQVLVPSHHMFLPIIMRNYAP